MTTIAIGGHDNQVFSNPPLVGLGLFGGRSSRRRGTPLDNWVRSTIIFYSLVSDILKPLLTVRTEADVASIVNDLYPRFFAAFQSMRWGIKAVEAAPQEFAKLYSQIVIDLEAKILKQGPLIFDDPEIVHDILIGFHAHSSVVLAGMTYGPKPARGIQSEKLAKSVALYLMISWWILDSLDNPRKNTEVNPALQVLGRISGQLGIESYQLAKELEIFELHQEPEFPINGPDDIEGEREFAELGMREYAQMLRDVDKVN